MKCPVWLKQISKLRACDLRNLKVQDVSRSGCVMSRALVEQQKSHQEAHSQQTLSQWIIKNNLTPTDYVFPSPRRERQPTSYHYYTTMVNRWVTDIGLDKAQYGTHSLRRTKSS